MTSIATQSSLRVLNKRPYIVRKSLRGFCMFRYIAQKHHSDIFYIFVHRTRYICIKISGNKNFWSIPSEAMAEHEHILMHGLLKYCIFRPDVQYICPHVQRKCIAWYFANYNPTWMEGSWHYQLIRAVLTWIEKCVHIASNRDDHVAPYCLVW